MSDLRTDAPWLKATKTWLKADEAAKKSALTLAKARFKLTLLAAEASANGNGVSVLRYFTAGKIDYGRIPELAGVALDEYRKPGKWQFQVTKD